MNSKKWYASKTIWSGIIAVLIVVYNGVQVAMAAQCGIEGSFCVNIPAIPEFVFGILAALGIYSRSVAKTEIK